MPIRAPREQKKRRWVWWGSKRGEEKRRADERVEGRKKGGPWAKQEKKVNTCGTNMSEGTKERTTHTRIHTFTSPPHYQ